MVKIIKRSSGVKFVAIFVITLVCFIDYSISILPPRIYGDVFQIITDRCQNDRKCQLYLSASL